MVVTPTAWCATSIICATVASDPARTPGAVANRMVRRQPSTEPIASSNFAVLRGTSPFCKIAPNGILRPMMDWSTCEAVEQDPGRYSGAWLFRGTRVPVAALFENLEDGARVDQFVEWFPGVSLEQARAVLEHAARSAVVSVQC